VKFELNKPFISREPLVDVDPGLPAGAYHFRLVVVNDRDVRSKPTEAIVIVGNRLVAPPFVLNPGLITPIPIVGPR
jgi:hypothetical protein